MATDDPVADWQIPAFWIGAFGLVALIMRAAYFRLNNRFCAILTASISLFLFWTIFKAGMVRHDGHALIAGLSLACFAVISIVYTIKTRAHEAQYFSAAGSLVLGLSISSQYISPIRSQLDVWLKTELKNTGRFTKIIISSKTRRNFQELRLKNFNSIRRNAEDLSLIPKASGVDSMPWDITDIPANGLRYRPRPIIQSYSAYNPGLQELNRKHFLGIRAPSYLVMSAQSIDGRNPADLDYPSLEAIASRYTFIGTGSKGSLILKQINGNDGLGIIPKWRETRLGLLGDDSSAAKSLHERWCQLPQQLAVGSRFSLELKPSLWRRLQALAFKASPLKIAIKYYNGQIRTYRVLETTSRKIPLYPFVENNASLKSSLLALQGFSGNNLDVGPKPLAIRLIGEKGAQGLLSSQLLIEQPRFR